MSFLLLAIACSVLVSVLLKLAPRYGLDLSQMVLWNYLSASVLCFAGFHPRLRDGQHAGGVALAVLLGLLLPGLFVVMGRAVQAAGLARADIAQRLSLALSMLSAFALFGERFGTAEAIAVTAGGAAMLGIVRPASARDARGTGWLLLVWVGYAAVDVLLKLLARQGLGVTSALQIAFGVAFATMAAGQMAARRGRPVTAADLLAGLLLGALNFGDIYGYVRAHQAWSARPALVFAAMNAGVFAASIGVGYAVFREKASRANLVGVALAAVCLAAVAL